MRITFNNSSWVFLPEYSDVPLSDWLPYLKSKNAITKTAASICEKVFNDQQLSIGISEIIGDSEVDSDEIIGAILAREQEVIDYLEPFPTFFTDRIRFLSDSV